MSQRWWFKKRWRFFKIRLWNREQNKTKKRKENNANGLGLHNRRFRLKKIAVHLHKNVSLPVCKYEYNVLSHLSQTHREDTGKHLLIVIHTCLCTTSKDTKASSTTSLYLKNWLSAPPYVWFTFNSSQLLAAQPVINGKHSHHCAPQIWSGSSQSRLSFIVSFQSARSRPSSKCCQIQHVCMSSKCNIYCPFLLRHTARTGIFWIAVYVESKRIGLCGWQSAEEVMKHRTKTTMWWTSLEVKTEWISGQSGSHICLTVTKVNT